MDLHKITIPVEDGIARGVILDDIKLKGVTDLDISHDIDCLPKVVITLMAQSISYKEVEKKMILFYIAGLISGFVGALMLGRYVAKRNEKNGIYRQGQD